MKCVVVVAGPLLSLNSDWDGTTSSLAGQMNTLNESARVVLSDAET